jgi:hypothetical protein
MATVDLGKISFTQKGTWNSGTAYVSKDVVQYTDDNETSSYVAVASSTNQAPSTNGTVNTSYWALFAKGATVGSTNEGVWDVATAYQKNAVVQYTDTGVVSTYLAVADSTGETPSTGGTVNSSYWQLIAKGTDSVGISWQSSIVTGTTLTALAGNGYWIDTTSNACTVTLPASASVGDTIEFSDYARTWATNNVTINQNSLNFQGATTPNPVYDVNGQSIRIVYSGATQGWIPTSDDDVILETPQTYTADFLVIAGGGAGGYDQGGGGGAGGYRSSYSTEPSGGGGSAETALTFNPGTVYTITVGAGGTGVGSTTTPAGEGNDSSISGSDITTITSIGGGRGGNYNQPSYGSSTGGSGGGGAGGASTGYPGSSGTANQGFAGGNGTTATGAGGGGASAAAGNSSSGSPSAGGDGVASTITGSSVTRGGGGGSMAATGPGVASLGGAGGGGDGTANTGVPGGSGTANTGGGGGGSWNVTSPYISGAGGSGVVILRVPTAKYSGTTTGSPTVGTDGTDTILTFTGSGTYTG